MPTVGDLSVQKITSYQIPTTNKISTTLRSRRKTFIFKFFAEAHQKKFVLDLTVPELDGILRRMRQPKFEYFIAYIASSKISPAIIEKIKNIDPDYLPTAMVNNKLDKTLIHQIAKNSHFFTNNYRFSSQPLRISFFSMQSQFSADDWLTILNSVNEHNVGRIHLFIQDLIESQITDINILLKTRSLIKKFGVWIYYSSPTDQLEATKALDHLILKSPACQQLMKDYNLNFVKLGTTIPAKMADLLISDLIKKYQLPQ